MLDIHLSKKGLFAAAVVITVAAALLAVLASLLFHGQLSFWAPGFLLGIILLSSMNVALTRRMDPVTLVFQLSVVPLFLMFVLQPLALPFRIPEMLLVLTLALTGWGIGRLTGRFYIRIVSLVLTLVMVPALLMAGEERLFWFRLLYPLTALAWIIASVRRWTLSFPARLSLVLASIEFVNFTLPVFLPTLVFPSVTLLVHAGYLLIPYILRSLGERDETKDLTRKESLLTDPVCNLPNRRWLEETIFPGLNEARGNRIVVLMEIDNLMDINSRAGFSVGDGLLRNLTSCLKATGLKEDDILCRYSGLQFLLIREGTRAQTSKALDFADKVRQRFLAEKIPDTIPTDRRPGLSCGAALHPSDSGDIHEVIRKADLAIRYSRKDGENRSAVWSPAAAKLMETGHSEFFKSDMLMDFVLSLARAIDAKDAYTGQHSQEVSRYALMIADVLALPEDQRYSLRMGGLLHDVGKLGIPDLILQKQSRLDDQEFKVIQSHTTIGYHIAHQIFQDSEIISCVRNHHEKWDGSGYPDGLCGEQIPLLSRIICVADAYHAMVSTRVYRKAMSHKQAMSQLMEYSNKQFDPVVISAFMKANL